MSILSPEFISKSTELLADGTNITELEAQVLAATAAASLDAGQLDLPVGPDEIYANGEWSSRKSFAGALGSLVAKGLVSQDSNSYGETLYCVGRLEPVDEDALIELIKE